jgi:hypothetical protein
MKYFIKQAKDRDALEDTLKKTISGFGAGTLANYIVHPFRTSADQAALGSSRSVFEEAKKLKSLNEKRKLLWRGANKKALTGALTGGTVLGGGALIDNIIKNLEK